MELRNTDFSRFTTWLNSTMEARDLGVRQLAQYAEVSHTEISQLANGQRQPSTKTVRKLAGYFKIDEDWLLVLAGHRSPKTQQEKDQLAIENPELRNWVTIENLNKLSPTGVAAIVAVIKAEVAKSEPSLQDAMLQRLQEAPPLDMSGAEPEPVKKTSQKKKASNRDRGK